MKKLNTQFKIPFHKSKITPKALSYLQSLLAGQSQSEYFIEQCETLLETITGCQKVFLTSSGTTALELASLLIQTSRGSKVILPSFTFTSTANAFLRDGAFPLFADICRDDLNIDVSSVEQRIDRDTSAIVTLHYGGVCSDIELLLRISKEYDIPLIEDSAHSIFSYYKGNHLGTFGDMGILSFHQTKNISAFEGGALLLQRSDLIEAAYMIRAKGTNKHHLIQGLSSEYSWYCTGGNFAASGATAAILLAQLEDAPFWQQRIRDVWNRYHANLSTEKVTDYCALPPSLSPNIQHNGHTFYLVLPTPKMKQKLQQYLSERGIESVRHYAALHSSPMGQKLGYSPDDCPVTEYIANSLLRLPCHALLSDSDIDDVCDAVQTFFENHSLS